MSEMTNLETEASPHYGWKQRYGSVCWRLFNSYNSDFSPWLCLSLLTPYQMANRENKHEPKSMCSEPKGTGEPCAGEPYAATAKI